VLHTIEIFISMYAPYLLFHSFETIGVLKSTLEPIFEMSSVADIFSGPFFSDKQV
jgi:hypothetical protein